MKKSLITINDLTIENIQSIFSYADSFDTTSTLQVLKGKTIVLGFFEPSTRTALSFEKAAKNLGANVLMFNASSSSLSKGESFIDTIETINKYGVDSWIIRSKFYGASSIVKYRTNSIVVNAGDGQHQHPTQALLDAYTLQKEWGSIKGKNIVIVGDILHSRVARSNIELLQLLEANVGICCPGTLLPKEYQQWNVRYFSTLEKALQWADCCNMLRIQNERMTPGLIPSDCEYAKYFGLNEDTLEQYKDLIVLHPGPANYGVEITEECMKYSRVKIREQVRNGLFIRMGVFKYLFE